MAYDASPVAYDGSRESGSKTVAYSALREQCGHTPDNPVNLKNAPPGHNRTTKAWPFGYKMRCQSGQNPENRLYSTICG